MVSKRKTRSLITTIMLGMAFACSPQPEHKTRPDIDLSNFLYGPIESGCMYPDIARDESRKGLDSLSEMKFDSAYLHFKKAHELCPENRDYEFYYKEMNQYINNKTKFRI